MSQNVTDVVFNEQLFEKSKDKIIAGYEEVYAINKKISELQIKPGSAGGYTELKKVQQALADLKAEQDKLTASNKSYEQSLASKTKADKDALDITKKQTQADREQEKLSQDKIKTKKDQLTYEQAIQKEKARGLSQEQAELKIANQLTNEYGLLNKALLDAELKYKNLALTKGFDNKVTLTQLKEAQSIRAVLDKVDKNLNNNQRNVGNYASGFNGLNTSVQQILREAPSAVNSINTFFLAISNNLPMLFDEIGKAKAGLKDLKDAVLQANIALKEQTAIQTEANAQAVASNAALDAKLDTVIASTVATEAEVASVKTLVTEEIKLGIAAGETAAAIAEQSEQTLINSGIALDEAAAIRVQVEANALLLESSLAATTALEAQTLATAEANAAATAQPSLFKRLGSALFSVNSLLTVGVLLLTLYGGKLIEGIKGLFGYSDAEEKAAEATAKLQKAQLELIKTQEELNKIFANFNDPIGDTGRLEQQLKLLQALNRSKGDQLKIEQDILNLKQQEAQKAFLAETPLTGLSGFTAQRDFQQKLLESQIDYNEIAVKLSKEQDEDESKALQKKLDRAKITVDLYKKLATDQDKIVRDNFELIHETEAKQAQIEEYNRQQKILKETEFAKLRAQIIINENERILADGKKFEDERAKAIESSAKQKINQLREDLRKVTEDPANTNIDKKTGKKSFTSEALVAIRAEANAELEINKKKNVDLYNNNQEFYRRRLAAEKAIYDAEVSFAAAQYKQVSESQAYSLENRITAYGDYYRKQQEQIIKDHDFHIESATHTAEEIEAIDKEASKRLKELTVQSRKEISAIIVGASQQEVAAFQSASNLKLSKDELVLFKSLKNKEKFAAQGRKLTRDTQRAELNQAIANDQELQILTNVTAEDKMAAAQRVQDNQAKLNKLDLEDAEATEAKKQKNRELYFELEKIGVETFFSLLQKIEDDRFQKRIQQLEDEAKMLDENHAREIKNITDSTLSAQEKATAIQIADAQTAAKKQRIADEEKQLKIKQFNTDKAIAIAKIIIETALAVVSNFASSGYAGAILAGATGAAALAEAVAQQPPSFGEGTESTPAGDWIAGEKKQGADYEPEYVEKDGKGSWTSKPMLMNGAGYKVTPESKMDGMRQEMYNSMVRNTAAMLQPIAVDNGREIREVRDAVLYGNRMMIQALKKQKAPVVRFISTGNWDAKIDRDVRN